MDLSILAILVCCVTAALSLWFFAKGFAKNSASDCSFMPVDKPMSWFSLAGSFMGAQIGGSSILYTVEYAQSDGIFAMLYPLGSALGLLALGLGLGARISRLQISSIPDLFEKHYSSVTLRKVSCFLSMASILGLLIAQAMALKDLFRALGVQHDTLFIGAWIAIVFFTIRGGFKTSNWTALFQAILLIAILGAACFLSPGSPTSSVSFIGSFSGIQSELQEGFNTKFSAYLLMPCLFMFLEPEMVRNSLQVRSKREISVAVIFSGIMLLLCSFIPVYFGIAGRELGMEESSTSGLMSTVCAATNPTVTICSACILMVALISGASTLIWSLNVHLVKDLAPKTRSKLLFNFSWGWTILLGMIALMFSYFNFGIASLILESYQLAVVCMFVPLVQAACSKKGEYSKLAAGLSMFFGAIGFCLCKFCDIAFFPELFSVLLSWAGFMLGKALQTQKRDIQHADSEGLRCRQ
ncbi:MAG: hypothetical protein JSR37_06485 [Verrucomicrobia bacterium]|nr:hypothetical protein [Verrucomicrobiota bacterium]MBS0636767.1 hypothetical protein [Verrucomicrobiota bacterium]